MISPFTQGMQNEKRGWGLQKMWFIIGSSYFEEAPHQLSNAIKLEIDVRFK